MQNLLIKLKQLKTEALGKRRKLIFNYLLAINLGLGAGSSLFNLGLLIALGLLGFFSISMPAVGLFLLGLGFGLPALVLGGVVLYHHVTTFKKSTEKFALKIDKTEQEIQHLLAKRPALKALEPALIEKKHSAGKAIRGGQVAANFLGTMGTAWGIPNGILSLCNMGLLISGSFLTGGLFLMAGAAVLGGIIAYSFFHLNKDNFRAQKQLQDIRDTVATVKKKLKNEKNHAAPVFEHQTNINDQLQVRVHITLAPIKPKRRWALGFFKTEQQTSLDLEEAKEQTKVFTKPSYTF